MDVTNYEQQLSQLTESDIFKYILNLSDENTKLSLLKYLSSDDYKVSVINTFTSEQLKLEGVKQLQHDRNKIEIIKSLTNINLVKQSLAFLKYDSDKVIIINAIPNEIDRLNLSTCIELESERIKVFKTITDIKLKISSLSLLTNDYYKAIIINTIGDENIRYELLSEINDEYKKFEVIKTLGEALRIKSLELLENDSLKVKIIKKISDENTRLSLLKYLSSDDRKRAVIDTFTSEQLKVEGTKQMQFDSEKIEIIKSLTNINLVKQSLAFLKFDSSKVIIINAIPNEKDRLNLSICIESDEERIKVFKTINDIKLKISSLSLLTRDDCKAIIINTINDENVRYELLSEINDEYQKFEVIKTLGEALRIKSIKLLKSDGFKRDIIKKLSDENTKLSLLKYLNLDDYKIDVINTFTSEQLKLEAVKQLEYEQSKMRIIKSLTNINLVKESVAFIKYDSNKVTIINIIPNEIDRLNLSTCIELESERINVFKTITDDKLKICSMLLLSRPNNNLILEVKDEFLKNELLNMSENKEDFLFLVSKLVKNFINNNELPNYKEIMRVWFKNGCFEGLYHFDKNILRDVFDDKQIKILNECSNIKNQKTRKLYCNYVSENYENISMENIDKISQILLRIETSNSSELQAFGDLIAVEVLNHDNPLQYLSKVEEIFVKNNIPYVGKIFEVFKLLHSNPGNYRNYSPLLNRFNSSKHQMQMMDLIIFNDLLRCAFGSNNRSLKEFIFDIEKGNIILTNIMLNKISLDNLSDSDKSILINYLDRIEIILDSYDNWKNKKTSLDTNEELLLRINYIIDRLKLKGNNYKEIPDIIVKKLCGISGVDTLENAKKYLEYIFLDADKRNRERCNKPFILEEGDFVKGINDVKYLERILQNGSVSKEFLGDSANSDATPLDTDFSRILAKNMADKQSGELGRIIDSTKAGGYGSIWFVLKNDPSRIEITRDSSNGEKGRNLSPKFYKLEAFRTLDDGHYGIRTGFPSSEISYIVSRGDFDRIGLEIAINGFYIPVVNTEGKLVFTPEDYDNLRSKMNGLSYYGMGNYIVDKSIYRESQEVFNIIGNIEVNKNETKRKADLIENRLKLGASKLGLELKDTIDLSQNSLILFNTGSTGRFTNLPGDGDYDYTMQVDHGIYNNEERINELRQKLIHELGYGKKVEYSIISGDIRELRTSVIDESGNEYPVEIDITFTSKTDKTEYASDVCVNDRLMSIESEQERNLVKANIILAKQFLKSIGAYKPARKSPEQGGMGGIGVENWILQNGGTLYSASKSFMEVANKCSSFQEFQLAYSLPNFGYNHMAYKKGFYPHDDYIKNMNENGFEKMKKALSIYIEKYEKNIDSPVFETIEELNDDVYNLTTNKKRL